MTHTLSHYFSSGVKRFFSGVFLSRITGMGRDLAMAYAFGAHPAVAAFMVAYRFAHLFRRFFGEGPLQSVLIPHFEGLRLKKEEEANAFFRRLTCLLFLTLIALLILLETVLGSVLFLHRLSANAHEIISLTVWMLPSLLFICLYGLNVSLLQCHHVFFLPSVAPSLCNLVWIAGALYLKGSPPKEAMLPLVKWINLGFILQWLLTLPLVGRYVKGGIKKWVGKGSYRLKKEIKTVLKSFGFGVLGVGATQINACLDTIFSRFADLSGPIYLWYSIRFQQLGLALFGMAALNTCIPILSRAIKGGEIEKGKEIFAFGYRRLITVILPCTLALFVLGFAAIDLVFGRGNFSPDAVEKTNRCLLAYALGLLPTTLVMLHSAVLYAEGNFRTSTLFSLITIGLNIGLNSLFVFAFQWGPISIALATSMSAWCNYFLLQRVLVKKGWRSTLSLSSFIHILFAGIISALFAFFFTGLFASKILNFFLPALLFVGGLFLYGACLRNEDLKGMFRDYLTPNEGAREGTR